MIYRNGKNPQHDDEMIRLMELSTGGGCGCKFPYLDLEAIIGPLNGINDWSKDDAALLDIPLKSRSVVTSVDFIQPIVDDEFLYGKIAALHSMSDLFAKGIAPSAALVTLCWPRELIGTSGAGKVMEGIWDVCNSLDVKIIGGHSIDAQNPIVGLTVFGFSDGSMVEANTGRSGDLIIISKPVGVGIACNALHRNLLDDLQKSELFKVLLSSNRLGAHLAHEHLATSMTDVTGYGICRQLERLVMGTKLSVHVDYNSIPVLEMLGGLPLEDLETKLGKTNRVENDLINLTPELAAILNDPQTNGPLLFTADPCNLERIGAVADQFGNRLSVIGKLN